MRDGPSGIVLTISSTPAARRLWSSSVCKRTRNHRGTEFTEPPIHVEEPPRHQGITKITQSRPPTHFKPQIAQIDADPTRPPTSQPPKHQDTKGRSLSLIGASVSWRQNDRRSVDRLSPVRSRSSPNAGVRRSAPSHRPTCHWPVGSAFFSSKLLNEEENWRGLRSQSAGRWAGTPRRTLVSGAVARPNSPWPQFSCQDLATQKNPNPSAPLRKKGRVESASICVICGYTESLDLCLSV